MTSKLPQSLNLLAASGTTLPVPAEVPPAIPAWVRRVAGDGFVNLLTAKAEVEAVLRASGGVVPDAPTLADQIPADAIPSVARGRREDRILAEIDQDGFAFALDPMDVPYFNRRAERRPRPQNLVAIALIDGRVCVRKEFRELQYGAVRWGRQAVPFGEWLRRKIWSSLGFYLYAEAAALLRLHDLPYVPKLRRIEAERSAIYVDCIAGTSLRHLAASHGPPVHDHDLGKDEALAELTGRDLDRREVRLLDATGEGGDFRREIALMTHEINARGVAPLDIKLGNFLRGSATGRLYWIDFEISRLATQPRWDDDLALQHEILASLFG